MRLRGVEAARRRRLHAAPAQGSASRAWSPAPSVAVFAGVKATRRVGGGMLCVCLVWTGGIRRGVGVMDVRGTAGVEMVVHNRGSLGFRDERV